MIWKDIPNTPYEISEDGTSVRRCKPGKGTTIGRELRIQFDGNYYSVGLFVNGKSWWVTIHRLVAMAFIGIPPNGAEVNHKDGNKTNNHYTNLEYLSRADNLKHAYRIGIMTPTRMEGSTSPNATIDEAMALRIKKTKNTLSAREFSEKHGVSPYIVAQIRCGRTWKHVKEDAA